MLVAKSITEPTNVFSGAVGIIIGSFILAICTFGILLLMDNMECCLHCLRLHWVEFCNKFYKGDGKLFRPYSIENKLQGDSTGL